MSDSYSPLSPSKTIIHLPPRYHQHVIGHHAYANIPKKDPDLYHNGTFERHTKTLRWRPAHAHQWLSW